MKKKLLTLMMIFAVGLSTIGCGETKVVRVNVENTAELTNDVLSLDSLIDIVENELYYDSMTHIVYWWNGFFAANWATTPSPYYAPNGLPYRYNPETNTLEEINPADWYGGGEE